MPRVGAQRPAGGMGCKTPRVRGKVGGGGCDGQRSRVEINYFFPTSGFPKGGILGVQRLRTSPPTRLTSSPGGGCSLNDGGGGGGYETSPAGIFSPFFLPPVQWWFAEGLGLPRLQSNPSSSWRLRTASRARLRGFDFTLGSLSPTPPPKPPPNPSLPFFPALPSQHGWLGEERGFFFFSFWSGSGAGRRLAGGFAARLR